ncbi:MAG TPA: hypothetical protein PKW95_01640 [bacterium]|nr:hypothetical protein [bacterium]
MNYLDERERAKKAAPTLLALLEKPAEFNALFAQYREQDGLIDGAFLDGIPPAREVWCKAGDPATVPAILALPLPFREAVFYGLARDRQIAALQACLERTKDKDDKRSLKRTLYDLRQAGVIVETKAAKKPLFQRPADVEEVHACFVSAVDGRNERLLILNEPASHGVRTLQVYERGGDRIMHFHYDETSRKKMRQFIDDLRGVRHIPLFEVEAGFLYFLIERVRAFGRQVGHGEPSGFVSALARMAGASAMPTQHPYQQVVDGQQVLSKLADLSGCERLHRETDFAGWIVDEETIRALQVSLQDTATSGLTINDAQRAEQFETKIDRAIDRFFTEQRRLTYAERLRDTAYLLAARGQHEQAVSAAALALALEDRQRQPSSVEFFRAMLTKLFEPESKKNDQPPSGLIV